MSSICDVDHDIAKATKVCTDLLGSDAINEKKTVQGRQMDMLGWHIDLNSWTVYLSKQNFFETLIGFFTVDTEVPATREVVEKLASWASRYAQVVRVLQPFSAPFYRMCKGPRRRHLKYPWI